MSRPKHGWRSGRRDATRLPGSPQFPRRTFPSASTRESGALRAGGGRVTSLRTVAMVDRRAAYHARRRVGGRLRAGCHGRRHPLARRRPDGADPARLCQSAVVALEVMNGSPASGRPGARHWRPVACPFRTSLHLTIAVFTSRVKRLATSLNLRIGFASKLANSNGPA
jgi:hypothetical protein